MLLPERSNRIELATGSTNWASERHVGQQQVFLRCPFVLFRAAVGVREIRVFFGSNSVESHGWGIDLHDGSPPLLDIRFADKIFIFSSYRDRILVN